MGSPAIVAVCCKRRGYVKRDLDGGGVNGVQPRDGDRVLAIQILGSADRAPKLRQADVPVASAMPDLSTHLGSQDAFGRTAHWREVTAYVHERPASALRRDRRRSF